MKCLADIITLVVDALANGSGLDVVLAAIYEFLIEGNFRKPRIITK